MAVFVENALQHAKGSPAAPWVCCAMQPGSRDVKLAVLDLGTSVSHSSDSARKVRGAIRESREKNRSISMLAQEGLQRDLNFQIEIRAGSGFARYDGEWKPSEVAFSPGWASGICVQIGA